MEPEQTTTSQVVDTAVTSAYGITATFLVVEGFRADAYDTADLVFGGALFAVVTLGSVALQRRRLRRQAGQPSATR